MTNTSPCGTAIPFLSCPVHNNSLLSRDGNELREPRSKGDPSQTLPSLPNVCFTCLQCKNKTFYLVNCNLFLQKRWGLSGMSEESEVHCRSWMWKCYESPFTTISSSSSAVQGYVPESCSVESILTHSHKPKTSPVWPVLHCILSPVDCWYAAHLKISQGRILNAKIT